MKLAITINVNKNKSTPLIKNPCFFLLIKKYTVNGEDKANTIMANTKITTS
ncbi:hypothetical protein Q4Q39_09610 [Flavivirga amylovorans]|uniref:Uncharacterized protein n=1 Tax=Flavivirga amylovorans TaxID=870486 RepID=A0ABT8X1R2_9FLAO|nr:hypothetical protein [Flavivirga amylovorans]MDO5987653.1 hypothetical protein [Flavivirga amylovorans]